MVKSYIGNYYVSSCFSVLGRMWAMTCRGICLRYKAQRPAAHVRRYIIGQTRCQTCETYIQWKNLWCPCCGYRLRTKPRNKKYKLTLSNIKNKNINFKREWEIANNY